MNDTKKRHWDLLKDLRERLKKINFKINSKRKTLKCVQQVIYDDIYLLGDYCAKHLCSDDFDCDFTLRLIQNIDIKQSFYDNVAKELILLLESKDYLLKNIDDTCRSLGIENNI